jgi:hypothetical protein
MPWMPDGQTLWEFIKKYNPTILSMLPNKTIERCAPQKILWCKKELGENTQVIITPDSVGKSPYSNSNAILIDDNLKHKELWEKAGGVFIHHTSAKNSISILKALFIYSPETWISVLDALPEISKTYRVLVDYAEDVVNLAKWNGKWDESFGPNITHWSRDGLRR